MADNFEEAKKVIRKRINQDKIEEYIGNLEEDIRYLDRTVEEVGPHYSEEYILTAHLFDEEQGDRLTRILGVIDEPEENTVKNNIVEELSEPQQRHSTALSPKYDNVELDYTDVFRENELDVSKLSFDSLRSY